MVAVRNPAGSPELLDKTRTTKQKEPPNSKTLTLTPQKPSPSCLQSL